MSGIVRRVGRMIRLLNDLSAVERVFVLHAATGGGLYAGKHRRKKKARSRKRSRIGPKTK